MTINDRTVPFKNKPVRGIVANYLDMAEGKKAFEKDIDTYSRSIGMKFGVGYITLDNGEYKGPIAKFLTEEQKAEAAGNDREIEALLKELGQCGRFLAPDCREELLPVYLGAEAVRIFNKTGLAVSGKEYEAQELSELACRLEKWFCHYRMLWEKVSRESELRRIGDVVFWYCDLLRDMADKAEQRQK